MRLNDRITVIIPAYNEEKRISSVLDPLLATTLIDEIIIVNDGSTDKTAAVVQGYKDYNNVCLLNHLKNKGKGAALQAGIEVTEADIVVFLDADLVGLVPEHINNLVTPLLEDRNLQMTVGRLSGGRISVNLAQRILPILNGQRALRRDFLKTLPNLSFTKFGVEIFLSKYAKKRGVKVKEVLLRGLSQILKEEKEGFLRGFFHRLQMYKEGLTIWRQFSSKKIF